MATIDAVACKMYTAKYEEGILPKKALPPGRSDRREKRRAVVRPPVAATGATPASTVKPALGARPTASSARAAWAPVARTSGHGGMIRDEDYHYIYSDLRRIGVLAGSIVVVLIALTFVLR